MPNKPALTRSIVAARMAEQIGQPMAWCEIAIGAFIDCISHYAANRERVYLHGLGTFSVKDMKARKGRNPKTMEEIAIPAKLRLVFTPAKHLKDI